MLLPSANLSSWILDIRHPANALIFLTFYFPSFFCHCSTFQKLCSNYFPCVTLNFIFLHNILTPKISFLFSKCSFLIVIYCNIMIFVFICNIFVLLKNINYNLKKKFLPSLSLSLLLSLSFILEHFLHVYFEIFGVSAKFSFPSLMTISTKTKTKCKGFQSSKAANIS